MECVEWSGGVWSGEWRMEDEDWRMQWGVELRLESSVESGAWRVER